jgi:hypothetical protein
MNRTIICSEEINTKKIRKILHLNEIKCWRAGPINILAIMVQTFNFVVLVQLTKQLGTNYILIGLLNLPVLMVHAAM